MVVASSSSVGLTTKRAANQRRRKKLFRIIKILVCWIVLCILILRAGGGGGSLGLGGVSYSYYSLDPINLEILKNGTSSSSSLSSSSYQYKNSSDDNDDDDDGNQQNINIKKNKINDDGQYIDDETTTISMKLPYWMREYMIWHREQLLELKQQQQNWSTQKIRPPRVLIVRCLQKDRCGGTSDRLKSFPLFVLIAAKTSRLIFIRWSRPFPLEEFLLPGPALNWSIPTELQHYLIEANDTDENYYNYFEGKDVKKMIQAATDTGKNTWLIEGNIQYSGGQLYTNLVVGYQKSKGIKVTDYDYTTYYHDFFHNVFQLSPNIKELWQQNQQRQQHNLNNKNNILLLMKPNQYVVAHYRAKYPNEPYIESGRKDTTILKTTIINAIECAISTTRLQRVTAALPSSTAAISSSSSSSQTTMTHQTTADVIVYVASDTILAIELAKAYYSQQTTIKGRGGEKVHIVSHLDILSPSPPSMEEEQQISNNNKKQVVDKVNVGVVNEDPPHLNFANRTNPSSFYSIFIDLWAMHQSTCVSFGAGGFGRFGSLVSYNMSCRVAHSIKGKTQTC